MLRKQRGALVQDALYPFWAPGSRVKSKIQVMLWAFCILTDSPKWISKTVVNANTKTHQSFVDGVFESEFCLLKGRRSCEFNHDLVSHGNIEGKIHFLSITSIKCPTPSSSNWGLYPIQVHFPYFAELEPLSFPWSLLDSAEKSHKNVSVFILACFLRLCQLVTRT